MVIFNVIVILFEVFYILLLLNERPVSYTHLTLPTKLSV